MFVYAKSGADLMPPIFEAVEAPATAGTIANTPRAVFSEDCETVTV
jgi:hypothetical protein